MGKSPPLALIKLENRRGKVGIGRKERRGRVSATADP